VHAPRLVGPFPPAERFTSHVPDAVLDRAVMPVVRWAARASLWFRWVQQGSTHLYLLYIIMALILTLLIFR
jgi:hydrogenase-4 component B